MKKVLSTLFGLMLVISVTLGLASCGKDVEFNVNFVVDGEIYATVGTSGEETIKIPENPEKDGYIFDGWYWDNGTWQKPFTANSLLDAPLSSDMSAYAKWNCSHNASDWIIDKNSTCKETGSKHKECTKCEEVLETASIDKLTTHTLITDPQIEPTVTTTGLTEGSHCSECGAIIVAQEKIPALIQDTELKSAALTIEGDKITGVFSNATEIFSFLNDINVAKDANYVVAKDIYCESVINSKTVTLEEGDNTFYLLVTNGDSMKLYTATLRRRPMYTVRFNVNGGTSVSTQYVEEGYLAEEPTTIRAGYTFVSWDYNFDTPTTSNITINANWNANSDTPYRVEYYLENVDKNGYDIVAAETENLTGTTDTTVYAEQKVFEHFTFNRAISNLSGNINGDGKLVLKVYYTRNVYTLSNSNTNYGSITNAGSYVYGSGESFETVATVSKMGYEFLGWYSGEELLSTECEYTFNIGKNVVAKFEIVPEMQNFVFTSTATTCSITGIKNKTVTEIIVPDYVTSISGGAFAGCSSLESLTLPFVGGSKSATSANSSTLFGYIFGTSSYTGGVKTEQYYSSSSYSKWYYYIPSSLKSVTITGGNILYGAFYNCSSLTSVTIPDGVTNISGYAFLGCRNLTSVTIPDSVTSIGFDAFRHCSSLTSVTIPDSVTSIGEYAFSYCDSLTSVTIPNSVTNIGKYAFSGCTSLESISLPFVGATKDGTSNTHFGYIFGASSYSYNDSYVPSSLKTVVITDSTSIGFRAFYDCISLTSVTIPDGVTSIDTYAFYNCSSLTSVTIPDSITSIGESAFEYCTSLTSVTIPDSVTSIGGSAFYGCTSLPSVTIPNSITSIGYSAFRGCASLTSVTIPNSVTSIGSNAFYNCSSLTSFTVDENNSYYKSIDGNLYSKDGKTLIQYAIGKTDTSFTIPSSVTSIGEHAFYDCISLTSVTIPDSVTTISSSAFYSCDSLTSVTIPDSVTSIGSSAFEFCTSLTSVTIPNSVTIIGNSAFSYCSSLTSVTIPDSVTIIGDYAFYGCRSLKSIKYRGTSEQWNLISKGWDWNEYYSNGYYYTISYTMTYNYTGE